MRLASKGIDRLKEEERLLNSYNVEVKVLRNETWMQVLTNLISQLDEALQEIYACSKDKNSSGFVSRELTKAEFEADYKWAQPLYLF